MGRLLKPQKVDEVRDRDLGTVISIMLDRNTLGFFFEIAGEKFEHVSAEEAKKDARSKLKAARSVVWEAVIEVKLETSSRPRYGRSMPRARSAFLHLEFSRFERGGVPDEAGAVAKWKLQRDHALDVEPDDEHAARRREANEGDHYGWHDTTIPYSAEAWESLGVIAERIRGLEDRLRALMGIRPGDRAEEADPTVLEAALRGLLQPGGGSAFLLPPGPSPGNVAPAPAMKRRGVR